MDLKVMTKEVNRLLTLRSYFNAAFWNVNIRNILTMLLVYLYDYNVR